MSDPVTFKVTIWFPSPNAHTEVYSGVSDFYQGDLTLKFLNPASKKYILVVGLPFKMEAEQ